MIANRGTKPYAYDTHGESYTDVTTLKPFDGVVAPLDAVVIKKTKDVVFPVKKEKK